MTTAKELPKDEAEFTLEKMGPEIAKVLPEHIPIERFMRTTRTAISMNPDLTKCDRRLFLGEIMKCAQDGLLPNGHEAVMNIYKGKPKYIPMVAGLCRKARNSGEIASIDSQVVYSNDDYDAWIDEKGQHFKHRKAKGERGDEVCGYAYALTKDGSLYFEEMSVEEMNAVEKSSPGHTESWSPYRGPFRGEMRRKAPLRRLLKYRVPTSADLDLTLRRDDDLYDLSNAPKPSSEPGRPNRAAAIMGAAEPGEPGKPPSDGGELPI